MNNELPNNDYNYQQFYHQHPTQDQEQNTDPNIIMDQFYENMHNSQLDNYTQTSYFTSQNPQNETQQMSNNFSNNLSQQFSQNNLSSGIN